MQIIYFANALGLSNTPTKGIFISPGIKLKSARFTK